MIRRLLLTVCCLTIVSPTFADQPPKRPNVLFIMSDDLNTRIGCYGDPIVQTPNLDKLAARGVRFEHAYCQYALCGPSRNSLLCGLYPNSTGILANALIFRQTIPNRVSLPQAFRLDGYFASRIGKLYHYGVPNSVGTTGHDDPASWELQINPAGCDRLTEQPSIFSLQPNNFGGTLSWYASPQTDEQHTDGIMADDAQWVLKRCAERSDRPFFLAVGFYRPHTPYVAPQKYFDLYPLDKMPIATDVAEDVADVPRASLLSGKAEHDRMSDDLRRQAIQAYYASTTFMDAQVGKVLDALDAAGLTDNTIVVFTSDHGYHLSEKGLWQKQSLFEQSARVPMIIAAPGMTTGGVATAPVGLIDLYPTLIDLCNVPIDQPLHGQSLAPMLKDPAAAGRGFALTQQLRGVRRNNKVTFFEGHSIRTPRYRLTLWDGGNRGIELYDHQTDPLEKTNLAFGPAASQPENAAVIDELSESLQSQIAKTFPASGKRPEVRANNWMMSLTIP